MAGAANVGAAIQRRRLAASGAVADLVCLRSAGAARATVRCRPWIDACAVHAGSAARRGSSVFAIGVMHTQWRCAGVVAARAAVGTLATIRRNAFPCELAGRRVPTPSRSACPVLKRATVLYAATVFSSRGALNVGAAFVDRPEVSAGAPTRQTIAPVQYFIMIPRRRRPYQKSTASAGRSPIVPKSK
jgi:hypothetical protein